MDAQRWLSQLLPGDRHEPDQAKLSAEDFRVAFKAELQRQVMRAFFAEIQARTGDASIKDVVTTLSAGGDLRPALRVWYSRSSGSRIPGQEVLDAVRRAVPALRMNVRHPMLTWLASPDLDPRSVRRLKARMPDQWHQAMNILRFMPTSSVHASPELVKNLGLDRLDYLDAVMLFAVERVRTRHQADRKAGLDRILWLLPVLYPDDPLWYGSDTRKHRERHRWLLALVDHSLDLLGPDSPAQAWEGYDRLVSMFDQHWRLAERRRSKPQACRTQQGRRRYWARIWRF